MNSSDTWTSRGSPTTAAQSRTDSRVSNPVTSVLPKVSLRLVQKTSGLFNTAGTGNTAVVASEASKPGLDIAVMDSSWGPLTAVGEPEGDVMLDVPTELMDADYLDSFVDLSNFLLPDEFMKDPVKEGTAVGADTKGDVKETLSFSGCIPVSDDSVPTLPEPVVVSTVPATTTAPPRRKRKLAEYIKVDTDNVIVGSPADLGFELSVPDHEYVSKVPKLAQEVAEVKPTPSTSTATSKYRERRDKNNIASRRSRQIRKNKYIEMDKEADLLEVKNEALRKKIDELESLAKVMKAELIKKMTQK